MGLSLAPTRIPNSGYVACVFHYLTSELGRGTPADVAQRMAEVADPEALGLGLRPTLGQLHRLRLCLCDIQAQEAAREAFTGEPPADPLESLVRQLRWLRHAGQP